MPRCPIPSRCSPNLSRASNTLNNMLNGLNGEGRELLSNFGTLIHNSEWVNPDLTTFTPIARKAGVNWQDFYKHLPILLSRNEPESIAGAEQPRRAAASAPRQEWRGGLEGVGGEALQPKLNTIAATLMNFDSGQILDHFLAQVPAEGLITLRVKP